jgi:hypothetical protein
MFLDPPPQLALKRVVAVELQPIRRHVHRWGSNGLGRSVDRLR